MAINLNVNPKIHNKAYRPLLKDNTETQIIFGGSSSGKSMFLARRAVMDVFEGNRNYLCARNVASYIKPSIFREILAAISYLKLKPYFKVNLSELTITNRIRGTQFLFVGCDDTEKVKSIRAENGPITDLWVEEATEISEPAYNNLSLRLRGRAKVSKRYILSFNPIYRTHWIYKRFFSKIWKENDKIYKDEQLCILKTTYKDNRFLDKTEIRTLERYKTISPYHYNVYALGNWGVLGKLIYTNWEVQDLTEIRSRCDFYRNGLDFGYTNDPASFSRSGRVGDPDTIYIFDEDGGFGWDNPTIARNISPRVGEEIVTCDSAEPKSIDELKFGTPFINAMPCTKGPGSLLHGIQWLQQKHFIVDKQCQEHINELSIWQWKQNKNGEHINVPVDANNHWLDALRYAWDREINFVGLPGIYTDADYKKELQNEVNRQSNESVGIY